MTSAHFVLAATWVGLTAYVLFGGADFGAGLWDLLAGGARRGAEQRALMERTIGPVWEANHVWLIFVVVVLWTAFPSVFAAVFSTMYLPLTGAAVGIILRGAGFAFRKAVDELPLQRLFGATFAVSSVLTPFFLGAVAGGVASGRVPVGNAQGDIITSWLNPTSALGGTLAVLVCGYLAAVFLTVDAEREGESSLAEGFRRRALLAAVATGVVALTGVLVLWADAPALFTGLVGRAAPMVLTSIASGLAALALLVRRRYRSARIASAAAVAALIWGWGFAQYPYMLVDEITVAQAAANPATMQALLISLAVGAVLLIPSLTMLFVIFQRSSPTAVSDDDLTPQLPALRSDPERGPSA